MPSLFRTAAEWSLAMAKMSHEIIEKYQMMFTRDPNSKVFAPLAEAYRQMHLYREAEQVARHGIQKHPQFAGGLVTLAKILMDTKRPDEALQQLKKAAQVDPENILAHQLAASIYIDKQLPKEALKAYKMVLFLNPHSQKTKLAIEKLESFTADEYDEDVFRMAPLEIPQVDIGHQETVVHAANGKMATPPGLERLLSMADAYIVRDDIERAEKILQQAREQFGSHPLIENRHQFLGPQTEEAEVSLSPLRSREERIKHAKLEALQGMLLNVDAYRQKTYSWL
jgi:tetratricopeptide (TPR) repeat protein